MEGTSQNQYFPPHDSLAAEVLNKLQGNGGFSSVGLPEGYTLQHIPVSNPPMVSAANPMLNPSLVASSLSQVPITGDGVILSSASGLDPALTQLLVAAQSGNSGQATHDTSASLIPDVTPILASNMPLSLQQRSVTQNLHPILPTSASSQNQALNTPVLLPPDPTPSEPPAPANSSDAMTITVQCTMSDTVIVVGQQVWQCCMCRDMHGFDVSIDQHLALKHNLHIVAPPQQHTAVSTATASTNTESGQSNPGDGGFSTDDKQSIEASSLQTISEKSLALLKGPDSGRSGLEREVALLMAQTFTHSADHSSMKYEASPPPLGSLHPNKNSEFEGVQSDILGESASDRKKKEALIEPNFSVSESGTMDVLDRMIHKVERAMRSALEPDTQNDLLLVATELARMRKDTSSKRALMKKNHRYITCSVCNKEVRNRKDLIKQHNRCHETDKKFQCFICNKKFKYAHTLRRHAVQQGHGDFPEDVKGIQSSAANSSKTNSAAEASTLGKPVDEEEDDAENVMTISFSPSPPQDASKMEVKPESVEPSPLSDQPISEGIPAYQKILSLLLEKGEKSRSSTGKKLALLQCFVCDREIRNRNYYISRHARCHLDDLCYTCGVCGQEFYRSDFYRQHMLQHGVKPSAPGAAAHTGQVKTVKGQAAPRKRAWTPKPLTVPCKICGKGIFNRTYNIKRHAQQHSILEWETILGSTSTLSTDRNTPSKASASTQRSIRCGVCSLTFKSYSLKRRHMLKHRTSFPCRLCGSRFGSVVAMTRHARDCKKNPPASGDLPQVKGQQQGVEVENNMLSKQVPASRKKFDCPVCKASIINTPQSIKRHMRELHSDGQPHTCHACNRTYDSYHKLQRHVKSHGDTGGICHVCGKVFQTKAALRSHTKLHATPEGMYQCPQCPKSFRFQGRLEKHIKKHAERSEVCPHCNKVYISKIHLQRHISVVHLGVKDYRHKCEQCGAQFFESVQLRDHMAYRHQGIQLYRCKHCNKGFNCRPTMIRHERKEHTNYLPYKCKHCTQCFPEKSKLVAHEMTHTGVSPHKCDICGKYFTTGSALKAHKNLHMGVKPFVCTMCGKTYLKNWHLQQHMRKAHRAVQVMVYDLPSHNAAGQEVTQPSLDQPSLLPPINQSCVPGTDTKFLQAPHTLDSKFLQAVQAVDSKFLQAAQTGDSKFLHTPVQGEYMHMQPAAETSTTVHSSGNLQPLTHSLIQSHGQIPMQHASVYQ